MLIILSASLGTLRAARFTTGYVRLVGRELAPSKCVCPLEHIQGYQEGCFLRRVIGGLSSLMSEILGGHLDTTSRGWSATLASRIRLVIARLVLVFALSLDFHGRVRVVRSMFIPAALHGIDSSLLASDSLRKLRSSIHRVVWSRRQPLAGVGAVLSLMDGPTGCDPAYCVVWFRFRLLRRYLALWPSQVGRAYRLLEMVSEVCPGHGSMHLISVGPCQDGLVSTWVASPQ